MDAQEQHDHEMPQRRKKNGGKLQTQPGSKARLESLLAAKSKGSSAPGQSFLLDPIEQALRNHPGLTRLEAEKMASDLGF